MEPLGSLTLPKWVLIASLRVHFPRAGESMSMFLIFAVAALVSVPWAVTV